MRAIFNVSMGSDGQSHKTVSTNHNLFWRERRTEAVSNRGPFAYQPNALPLGQTGSRSQPHRHLYPKSVHGSPCTPVRSLTNKAGGILVVPVRAQELCENRGGLPGLPVTKIPSCLCGRFTTRHWTRTRGILSTLRNTEVRAQELCESRGGRPGVPSLINLRFLWT